MGLPIGVTARLTATTDAVTGTVNKQAFASLKHAGLSIAKSAIQSMEYTRGPSPAGTPPHAHKGRLRRSIWSEADGGTVVVGPAYSRMQSGGLPPWVASMHERGGTFKGKKRTRTYPARPFMHPALERATERFRADWEGA